LPVSLDREIPFVSLGGANSKRIEPALSITNRYQRAPTAIDRLAWVAELI
jgi:hypothetical protein